jgi:hypothetical protein
MSNYVKNVTSVVSAILFVLVGTIAPVANAQNTCPADCRARADALIPEGDLLRIVHNQDQEAIAVSSNGVTLSLLSFKNTSPSVQLYQSCYTGASSKIEVTSPQHSQCRNYYLETADNLGIPVSVE